MNWFEEQINRREQSDTEDLNGALDSITDAVSGTGAYQSVAGKDPFAFATECVLKHFKIRVNSDIFKSEDAGLEEQIGEVMRPYGILFRQVLLEEHWYRECAGAMIGTLRENGKPVALIPGNFMGYCFYDESRARWVRINRKTEMLFNEQAFCFYEPLPQKSLTIVDLYLYMRRLYSTSDYVLSLCVVAVSTLLNLLNPLFSKWLFGDVLDSGSINMLLSLASFMLSFSCCRFCFSAFESMIHYRIDMKQSAFIQAAVMNRIINLPVDFFKNYSSGELALRASNVQSLCSTMYSAIGVSGLSSIFSLVYIGQILSFAPSLAVVSIVVVLTVFAISLVTIKLQVQLNQRQMEVSAKTNGLTYSTIKGIEKIKLAGAEKRMFSRWAKQYSEEAKLNYNPPAFLKLSSTISLSVSLVGMMVIYAEAIKNGVSLEDYYAFNSAYGMISATFMAFSSIAVSIGGIKPVFKMALPIMEAVPEKHEDRADVHRLNGKIEISNLSFRYRQELPNVFEDFCLTVKPGEYLAVVGETGCGKSTLLRLLLGFEKQQKGSIFYDDRDTSKIDMGSVRRRIGVVMQDSGLFEGDIYSNIVISSPMATMEDAWKAAEIAAIADDIREMPMGMFTHVTEGQGGLSGGQKQRILIARAVVSKPTVLMFDEATSALDNITQSKVAESIDKMNCTRIVIAHRLSTIRKADRIIYLEQGTIAEQGTYDELIQKNGKFARLIERQLLNQSGFHRDSN